MKKLILVGGGGHCKSCIEVIESTNKYKIIGILEKDTANKASIMGYPILGNDELIPKLANKGYEFLITIGQIKSVDERIRLFNFIKTSGGKLATIISSTAYVSLNAKIREGSIIMHQAFINTEVIIGANCIINTRAVLEHDSNIGNNCHISVNTVLNGEVIVGDNSFVGSCAVLHHCVTIMPNTIIGAGSVVNYSLEHAGLFIGNPLKKIG